MKVQAIFSLTILLSLCVPAARSAAPVGPASAPFGMADWIPKDFDPKHTVLLIEIEHYINKKGKDYYEKQNRKFEEVMKENYPYPYELVSKPLDQKHKDTSKYPYMLGWHSFRASNFQGIQMSIEDLRTGKISPTNDWTNSFKHNLLKDTIRQLLANYEKQRTMK